jgi:signal transduction histidine kinase
MKRVNAFVDKDGMSIIGKFFILFAISYSLVVSIGFYFVIGEWEKYINTTVKIVESNSESDLMTTCDILDCRYILVNNKKIYRLADKQYSEKKPKETFWGEKKNKLLTIDVESSFPGYKFGIRFGSLVEFYINMVAVLYILLVTQSLVFLIRFLISHNIRNIMDGASNTAALHNKNMSILAEQLHHELNTPLSVVKELCDKVFKEINAPCQNDSCTSVTGCPIVEKSDKYSEISGYKRLIDNNLKQSFVVLERMAEAKQVRYSNGNKSLFDIAKATFDIMAVYNRTNYTYVIDDNMKKYVIDHSSGLKNHELMNILVNHIKNSLEAKATNIALSINKIVPQRISEKDMFLKRAIDSINKRLPSMIASPLTVFIYKMISTSALKNITLARVTLIDNGKGIPAEFVPSIFTLHASTKKKDGIIRGAGLYLNREILRSSYGDLVLHGTSGDGTIFVLDIPVVEKN